MDRISHLNDTLLLRILSELAIAEDVVATMVLSKRWLPLWKSVPNLVFDEDGYQDIDTRRFSRFVDRCLLLHKAPIETLAFVLTQSSTVADVGIWIAIAVQRCVRDLSINIDCTSSTTPVILPRSLYAGCGMLVNLELKSVTLVDSSSLPSFSVLKNLNLWYVKYPGEEFVNRLLSNCHVLQDLIVEQCLDDNVIIFTVKVPSLRYAYLRKSSDRYTDEKDGFVIDAPSLEFLVVYNNNSAGFCTIENSMPNIVKATVIVGHCPSGILRAITSVKRLCLRIPHSKDSYPVGSVFHRLVRLIICTAETEWFNLLMCVLKDSPSLKSLELQAPRPIGTTTFQQLIHLEICTCKPEWWNLLVCLLTAPPKVRVLKLKRKHRDCSKGGCWNEPGSAPDCLFTSLEYFEWRRYKETKDKSDLVTYILRNSCQLKMVKILTETVDHAEELEMIKKLAFPP